MNGFRPRIFVLVALSIIYSGCDVSDSSNSSGSQDPDPVVEDFPIAFIQRSFPTNEDGVTVAANIVEPAQFNPGARLIFKQRASTPAAETILSDAAFAIEPTPDPENPDAELTPIVPDYDVKDLEVSEDGSKLLFTMRAPEIENAAIQPTWNIWEYDIEREILRRIISSDLLAEEGEDVAPTYLPDGRIVFSSTRQRRSRAVLLDESKPQFSALTEDGEREAFNLHVMDENGGNIQQITFNQSHDLHPTLLSDGRLLFLRWDNFADANSRLSLYTAKPNGGDLRLLYGYHSQNTGTDESAAVFAQPRQLEDGTILVNLWQPETEQWGGDLVLIDTENFSDNQVTIDSLPPVNSAQKSLIPRNIVTNGDPSPDGLYNSAFPMSDGTGRLLLSWSACFLEGIGLNIYVNANRQLIGEQGQFVRRSGSDLNDTESAVVIEEEEVGAFPCTATNINIDGVQIARPRYGIWIYDPASDTNAPVVIAEQNTLYSEAVVIDQRPLPEFIADPVAGLDFDLSLAEENLGILHIRSVYDVDGSDVSPNGIIATRDPAQTPAEQRPARFLRIMKAVSRPDEDILDIDEGDFGNINRMRDILGYVPIEPDGSVKVQVPADVALTFAIVDATGKRIGPDGSRGEQHANWFSLRAGETYECKGCHEGSDSDRPHGRADVGPESINPGAIEGVNFPNTSLRDDFGTLHPLAPESGETMAEYRTRMNNGSARQLSMNMVDFNDWQDDGVRPRQNPLINIQYANVPAGAAPTDCLNQWNSLCRSVINYEQHIQPLWSAERQVLDANSNVLANNRCTICHSASDADGAVQLPAGNLQLNLSDTQSVDNIAHLTSYDELFRSSLVVEVNDDGLLQPETEHLAIDGVLQFQANDADDNLVPAPADNPDASLTLLTDANGQLIPFVVNTGATIGPVMNRNGALRNTTFFNVFEIGGGTVDHTSFLNSAELKLIAEWLDIGGQYFNNPFDAPED